jgi:hypothetical protein
MIELEDWNCKHCAPRSGPRWSLPDVENHLVHQYVLPYRSSNAPSNLSTRHGIIDPDSMDYYSAPWGLQTIFKIQPVCFAMARTPAPVRLPIKQGAPNKKYHCLHCATGRRGIPAAKRQFMLGAVRYHIKDTYASLAILRETVSPHCRLQSCGALSKLERGNRLHRRSHLCCCYSQSSYCRANAHYHGLVPPAP